MNKFYIFLIQLISFTFSQIVQVGAGSYTRNFPGTDVAGRNSYPSGQPQTTGPASLKHCPTNDWWSSLIKNDHANNLFNYPLALKTTNEGLVISYIPQGVYDDQEPIVVGLSDLNSTKAKVYDFSDWTVTIDWSDSNNSLKATAGIGMPFLYFTKDDDSVVEIDINLGQVSVFDEVILVQNARNNADFVIYAPNGSNWQQSGNKYSSTLNGKNYWSVVMLPQTYSNLNDVINDLQKYAYVFPQNSTVEWSYNNENSTIYSDFTVEVDVKEGPHSNVLMGLLPHQWNNLSDESPYPGEYIYNSIRGNLKMLNGNTFNTKNLFSGILPTLPSLSHLSSGFNPADLQEKIALIQNNQLAEWTDSYNEGQVMNRLIQTGRIAHEIGNFEARDQIVQTVKARLEDWLTASSNEVAFIFYYNTTWSTLIGYPSGHGQDSNINDHHFHWGYFIHAASFIEQFIPGWADDWGEMVNQLVRDAASPNRNDPDYPFLRSFSPYAGHCWANGFATFPQGNDQESTSESMQFNSSLIHWGSITGNNEIRDLGIYLYTTERTAIDEYWFDMYNRNFSNSQQYSLVSRVWGNSYDNGTFWTNDIAASYGIEMYPIHGGSFYLAHNLSYATLLWNEITLNTGILDNEVNPNLWHDVYWKYLSLIDAQSALDLYNSNTNRTLKFGVSDAHTYYWLHNMNALGQYRSEIVADWPISASFNNDGQITYVGHNYTDEDLIINFSDGYQLLVEPKNMATNRGTPISGTIRTDFEQAYVNGSVQVYFSSDNENIDRVDFYKGTSILGSETNYPFDFRVDNLALGTHNIYAKIFSGEDYGLSNFLTIIVGEQISFEYDSNVIPGILEPGKYDSFEGGQGQNISYYDNSPDNKGNYRSTEFVDVEYFSEAEGPTLGWIEAEEWLEYSVSVSEPAFYDLSYRFSSENISSNGAFYFEINGTKVSEDIYPGVTGDWNNWQSGSTGNIELNAGKHTLRLVITEGGFNLGRMTFIYDRPLDYQPPQANAGNDKFVIFPSSNSVLNGELSTDLDTEQLSYFWSQIYGPSIASISGQSTVSAFVNDLVEGVYKFKLFVSDGSHSSTDFMYVFVSSSEDFYPSISLITSNLNATYHFGSQIEIEVSATDIDGSIELIEFYDNDIKIGELNSEPYKFLWENISLGNHIIKAVATDNDGLSKTSSSFEIEIIEAALCTGGPDNGDYTYELSDDLNNPTITFIPSQNSTGNPTCILYYAQAGVPPGYNVIPNQPFQLYANEGETIQFYYTYSFNGLEKNTAANPHSYEIGSCYSENLSTNKTTLPSRFSLKQNYPNPFNPSTKIQYELPSETFVSIDIYDLRGSNVITLVRSIQSAGYKEISWNGLNSSGLQLPAGIYFLTIQTEEYFNSKKMILLQ